MKSFLIVGMGSFGHHLCRALADQKCEVMVADQVSDTLEDLLPLVASGKVAIPANKNHHCLSPEGIGSMLRTKINVNLGVSRDCKVMPSSGMYHICTQNTHVH